MTHIDEPRRYYYGTKAELERGDLIDPGAAADGFIHLAGTLDAASWQGETGLGDGPGRIYVVEPTGPVVDAPVSAGPPVAHLAHRSRHPVRIIDEITDEEGRPERLYHGTKADLKPGDLVEPGYSANFGEPGRVANHVYLAGTLDAAIWGAELARGSGPGRIYVVEPTGPITDDPNVTNAKYPGNPTKSYRSRDPLRITEELTDWEGHAPEVLKAMKDGLKKLDESGINLIDD